MTPLHITLNDWLERAERSISILDSGDPVRIVESVDSETAMKSLRRATARLLEMEMAGIARSKQREDSGVVWKLRERSSGHCAARSGIASARFLLSEADSRAEWSQAAGRVSQAALDLKTDGVGLIEGEPVVAAGPDRTGCDQSRRAHQGDPDSICGSPWRRSDWRN